MRAKRAEEQLPSRFLSGMTRIRSVIHLLLLQLFVSCSTLVRHSLYNVLAKLCSIRVRHSEEILLRRAAQSSPTRVRRVQDTVCTRPVAFD